MPPKASKNNKSTKQTSKETMASETKEHVNDELQSLPIVKQRELATIETTKHVSIGILMKPYCIPSKKLQNLSVMESQMSSKKPNIPMEKCISIKKPKRYHRRNHKAYL